MLRWLHSAAAKQHPHQLQQPAGAGPKGSKASKGSKGLKGSKGSSSPPTGGTLVSSDPLATLSFSDPRHIYAVSRVNPLFEEEAPAAGDSSGYASHRGSSTSTASCCSETPPPAPGAGGMQPSPPSTTLALHPPDASTRPVHILRPIPEGVAVVTTESSSVPRPVWPRLLHAALIPSQLDKHQLLPGKPCATTTAGATVATIPKVHDPFYQWPVGDCRGDLTLDSQRAARLVRKLRASKRHRCWCRAITSILALLVFLLTLIAVTLVLTRGQRVFGSL